MKKLGARDLFDRLIKADTEAEVVEILKEAGYWDDPAVWRFYGDQPENWATVGNQQSRAEQALIEKAMNSIDTKLIAAACIKGIPLSGDGSPQSIFDARDLLFREELKYIEQLSRSITIAATGKKKPTVDQHRRRWRRPDANLYAADNPVATQGQQEHHSLCAGQVQHGRQRRP